MNLSIFILAAGLGERLRPITNHIPKPLLPILGKPVLQSILEKISSLPINNIGINLHHKKKAIENRIKQFAFSKNIELFPEKPILGTGGAFKNAELFLKNGIFLVHNSDIISDIDLLKLIEFHISSKNLVTLAVHDYPEFNNLAIDKKGFLKGIGKAHDMPSVAAKWLAFTGISVYSPDFLNFLPAGISSIVDTWLKVMREGYKIGTLDVSGCYWSDIGTAASYAKAVINGLKENGETVYIHPSVNWCRNVELDGYVVIEKTSNPPSPPFSKGGTEGFSGKDILNRGISLRNCIVLPGAMIEIKEVEDRPSTQPLAKGGMGGWLFENCILGPGFKIDLNESDFFNKTEDDIYLIGTGGSDRKYYRVRNDKYPVVLMQCPDDDPDFQRNIEYTQFFKKYSIPVPDLKDFETDKRKAFFEDLGDLSLYSWLKCPREQKQIENIYKQVIELLLLIHTLATEHVSECPLLYKRTFDYEHLRWETGYFIERFVKGIRNIKIKNPSVMNDELHRLAVKVDAFPKSVIHRDFQSQNIMITKRGIPRILDYQGARMGPPAYDLASILWDPYYRLEDNLRERLLNCYINEVSKIYSRKHLMKKNLPTPPLLKGGKGGLLDNKDILFNKTDFKLTLFPCRLQRHMQAIGAYGFLSKVKGKKYFLKYIPEGLRLLKEDVLLSKDEYPGLYDLTMKL